MTTDEYIRASLLDHEARIAAARADIISKILILIEDERRVWENYLNNRYGPPPEGAVHKYDGAINTLSILRSRVEKMRDAS